jgi:outer membrane protein TolC
MAILVKDGLAMRLTYLANRLTLAAAALVVAGSAGCQRLPYLDTSKKVPSETLGTIADEDKAVKQANFLRQPAFDGNAPVAKPKIARPRTTDNPEADEIWPVTLQDALRIGLDNSEVVRVISLGAQGIPVGGFEPTPLNTGAGAGIASSLGSGTLTSVYDPAIQETQISTALANFDTTWTTSMLWGHSVTPVNNGISAGTIPTVKFPIIFDQDTGQFSSGLQKRTATGAVLQVQQNVQYAYSNSPGNVFPSAYTTNLQFQFTQPLLGGTAQNPSGLEANRANIVIARLNADASVWNFKAAVMAHVRSIEQQYWALSQQQIQLWSRETAVKLGEEIVRRERAELEAGRGTTADVAEAQQNLERFELAYITATSDTITTERQLRNILGLPPADNRRIIPVTAPTEARIEPDWETSLSQMLAYQPDIVQQQILVRVAELQLLLQRNQLLPQLNLNALYQLNGLGPHLDNALAVQTGMPLKGIDPRTAAIERAAGLNGNPASFNDFQSWQVGLTYIVPLGFRNALAGTRQFQYQLLRQKAFLQQVVHQTTHSLARFFLEVDANFKQFKTAQRLRQAAQIRLESARAYYEEGRTGFTIDRLLDAVSQYADAIAQEAQYKTSYNTSIAAMEEAKGTLLAYDNIAVNEGPSPRKAYIQARDQQAAHRQFHIPPDGDLHPNPTAGTRVPDPVPNQPPPNTSDEQPKALFPAPSGPLGPAPIPVPPAVPASEVTPITDNGGLPPLPAGGLPPLPADRQVAPASATAPAPAGGIRDLPQGIDVDLPPLPK